MLDTLIGLLLNKLPFLTNLSKSIQINITMNRDNAIIYGWLITSSLGLTAALFCRTLSLTLATFVFTFNLVRHFQIPDHPI